MQHADDEVADAVVEALFEPICRDYQSVARELERMPADGVVTAHDLVARLREVFLGDVEDALGDLVERGVLVRDRDKYRWADGPRDLSDFISDCSWSAADQYQSAMS